MQLSNSVWGKAKLTLLLALPIVLWCLPATFFDSGKSTCLSQVLLQQECYGCGTTRAIMHLLHADLSGAVHYNKLSLVVLPLLALLWLKEVLATLGYRILRWL